MARACPQIRGDPGSKNRLSRWVHFLFLPLQVREGTFMWCVLPLLSAVSPGSRLRLRGGPTPAAKRRLSRHSHAVVGGVLISFRLSAQRQAPPYGHLLIRGHLFSISDIQRGSRPKGGPNTRKTGPSRDVVCAMPTRHEVVMPHGRAAWKTYGQ